MATVSDGKVKAVSEGTATITVTTKDGNYSSSCKVTVTSNTTVGNIDNEKKEDPTVSTEKLPQTGTSMTISIISIIVMSIIAIVMYRKYKEYKNIK